MKRNSLFRTGLVMTVILLAVSCSKGIITPPPSPPPPPPPPPTSLVMPVNLNNWVLSADAVFINSFPGFFKGIDTKGKNILVKAHISYHDYYSFDAVINERSASFCSGILWAEISGDKLNICYHPDYGSAFPSLDGITLRIVVVVQ